MKLASFNIQNLFHRNRGLLQKDHGKNITEWIEEFDSLLRKKWKDANDNNRIKDLSYLLGFERVADLPHAILKRQAGELCFRGHGFQNSSKASFLTDWEGWVKVGNRPLHHKAIQNKANVIAETDPDILILQEVEDRASLVEFNETLLPLLKISPFEQVMVFETNDDRGMGMGILLKNGYKLNGFKNHLHDLDGNGLTIFDVDCQEYEVLTPKGENVYILSAQFSPEAEQRKMQARKVAEIYKQLQDEGKGSVILCGTLNHVAYSECLSPIIQQTDLKDITKNKHFKAETDLGSDRNYFSLGAYRMGVNIKQQDYLLLAPHLFEKIEQAGMDRKATWPDRKPNWKLYPSISSKQHAASEHPLLWSKTVE
jgi:endonuclease/exonuclease/phosphatase family metal-dependent hydrolase